MRASRSSDQFILRLPDGMRTQIAEKAKSNGRSMNSEVVDAIHKHLMEPDYWRRMIQGIIAEERQTAEV